MNRIKTDSFELTTDEIEHVLMEYLCKKFNSLTTACFDFHWTKSQILKSGQITPAVTIETKIESDETWLETSALTREKFFERTDE
jgi:hypothetical protein